jgi:hypothetical protein
MWWHYLVSSNGMEGMEGHKEGIEGHKAGWNWDGRQGSNGRTDGKAKWKEGHTYVCMVDAMCDNIGG